MEIFALDKAPTRLQRFCRSRKFLQVCFLLLVAFVTVTIFVSVSSVWTVQLQYTDLAVVEHAARRNHVVEDVGAGSLFGTQVEAKSVNSRAKSEAEDGTEHEGPEDVRDDGLLCLAWRQTAGCDPRGKIEVGRAKRCSDVINPGESGFCEFADNTTEPMEILRFGSVGCDHPPFTCDSIVALRGHEDLLDDDWEEIHGADALKYFLRKGSLKCVAWRQEIGCGNLEGTRNINGDLSCEHVIQQGSAGFCEFRNVSSGTRVRAMHVGCDHRPFRCGHLLDFDDGSVPEVRLMDSWNEMIDWVDQGRAQCLGWHRTSFCEGAELESEGEVHLPAPPPGNDSAFARGSNKTADLNREARARQAMRERRGEIDRTCASAIGPEERGYCVFRDKFTGTLVHPPALDCRGSRGGGGAAVGGGGDDEDASNAWIKKEREGGRGDVWSPTRLLAPSSCEQLRVDVLTEVSLQEMQVLLFTRDMRCLGWRESTDCSPVGHGRPRRSLPCDQFIPGGVGGFCEFQDKDTGRRFRTMSLGCAENTVPFRCGGLKFAHVGLVDGRKQYYQKVLDYREMLPLLAAPEMQCVGFSAFQDGECHWAGPEHEVGARVATRGCSEKVDVEDAGYCEFRNGTSGEVFRTMFRSCGHPVFTCAELGMVPRRSTRLSLADLAPAPARDGDGDRHGNRNGDRDRDRDRNKEGVKDKDQDRDGDGDRDGLAAAAASAAAKAVEAGGRAWLPARVNRSALHCLAWRETADCSPSGPRMMQNDWLCNMPVSGSSSGYCEFVDKRTGEHFQLGAFACGHPEVVCEALLHPLDLRVVELEEEEEEMEKGEGNHHTGEKNETRPSTEHEDEGGVRQTALAALHAFVAGDEAFASPVSSTLSVEAEEELVCVGWRQTDECRPDAAFSMDGDLDCDQPLRAGSSGYCEYLHLPSGRPVRLLSSTCGHGGGITCRDALSVLRFTQHTRRVAAGSSPGPLVEAHAGQPFRPPQELSAAGDRVRELITAETDTAANAAGGPPPPLLLETGEGDEGGGFREFPTPVLSGRGVVMTVHRSGLLSAFASISVLRELDCELPVELWWGRTPAGEPEVAMDNPLVQRMAAELNVSFRELPRVPFRPFSLLKAKMLKFGPGGGKDSSSGNKAVEPGDSAAATAPAEPHTATTAATNTYPDKDTNPKTEEATLDVRLRGSGAAEACSGFFSKICALFYSSFEETLLLDADNVPTRDPSALFSDAHYAATGALFWPDFWHSSKTLGPSHMVWRLFGEPYREGFEQESGQLLLNKRRHARPLQLLMHYVTWNPRVLLYSGLWGDKDLYRFAFYQANASFHMVEALPGTAGLMFGAGPQQFCGMTMVQHDADGDVLFMHRNHVKIHEFNGRFKVWHYLQQPRSPLSTSPLSQPHEVNNVVTANDTNEAPPPRQHTQNVWRMEVDKVGTAKIAGSMLVPGEAHQCWAIRDNFTATAVQDSPVAGLEERLLTAAREGEKTLLLPPLPPPVAGAPGPVGNRSKSQVKSGLRCRRWVEVEGSCSPKEKEDLRGSRPIRHRLHECAEEVPAGVASFCVFELEPSGEEIPMMFRDCHSLSAARCSVDEVRAALDAEGEEQWEVLAPPFPAARERDGTKGDFRRAGRAQADSPPARAEKLAPAASDSTPTLVEQATETPFVPPVPTGGVGGVKGEDSFAQNANSNKDMSTVVAEIPTQSSNAGPVPVAVTAEIDVKEEKIAGRVLDDNVEAGANRLANHPHEDKPMNSGKESEQLAANVADGYKKEVQNADTDHVSNLAVSHPTHPPPDAQAAPDTRNHVQVSEEVARAVNPNAVKRKLRKNGSQLSQVTDG